LHSTGFGDFRYIYDVHDVIKMGELWPTTTFFTPESPTPINAAAADIYLTLPPPKKIDRRAAAAGQNHPARRRRKNDVGAGL